jgi:hypothetical protein
MTGISPPEKSSSAGGSSPKTGQRMRQAAQIASVFLAQTEIKPLLRALPGKGRIILEIPVGYRVFYKGRIQGGLAFSLFGTGQING